MSKCKRCQCDECKLNHKVFQYMTTKYLWVPLNQEEYKRFDYNRQELKEELILRAEKQYKEFEKIVALHKKPLTLWEKINNKLIEYYGISRKTFYTKQDRT